MPTAKGKTKSRGPEIAKKRIHIRSRSGLHARPAALFVQVANRFRSTVKVRRGRRLADGKSIMGVLTLAAGRGAVIEITAQGPDAQDAIRALEQILCRAEVPSVVMVVKHHRVGHG